MTQDAFQQQTLFADPLGLRLRHAREGKRWSIEAVAQQLKLPVAVVEAIEKEDWARLGAPIYARSYLTSYLRVLGLPTTLADEVLRAQAPQAPLVAMGGVPAGKRMVDRSLVNLGYLAITAAIVGSVVMLAMRYQSPTRDPQVLALDSPTPAVAPARTAAAPAPKPAAAAPASPVMASMAPTLPEPATTAPVAVATQGELLLRFTGQSWIEIVGGDGRKVEQGLVGAGAERRFKPGEVTRITLGNADAVEVIQGGRTVDLGAYRQASIARFGVSSEGVLTPPGG